MRSRRSARVSVEHLNTNAATALVGDAGITCEHAVVIRLPPLIVLMLCLLLALTRVLGLHAHYMPSSHHDAAAALQTLDAQALEHDHDHSHDHSGLIAETASDHLAVHMAHGEVDADSPDKTTGKLPPMLMIGLLSAIAGLLLLPRRAPRHADARREHRNQRRWTHFKPLSHAPPLAG